MSDSSPFVQNPIDGPASDLGHPGVPVMADSLSSEVETAVTAQAEHTAAPEAQVSRWSRAAQEVVTGLQTLFSAAVYASLIVTFGFQVARGAGSGMEPDI